MTLIADVENGIESCMGEKLGENGEELGKMATSAAIKGKFVSFSAEFLKPKVNNLPEEAYEDYESSTDQQAQFEVSL